MRVSVLGFTVSADDPSAAGAGDGLLSSVSRRTGDGPLGSLAQAFEEGRLKAQEDRLMRAALEGRSKGASAPTSPLKALADRLRGPRHEDKSKAELKAKKHEEEEEEVEVEVEEEQEQEQEEERPRFSRHQDKTKSEVKAEKESDVKKADEGRQHSTHHEDKSRAQAKTDKQQDNDEEEEVELEEETEEPNEAPKKESKPAQAPLNKHVDSHEDEVSKHADRPEDKPIKHSESHEDKPSKHADSLADKKELPHKKERIDSARKEQVKQAYEKLPSKASKSGKEQPYKMDPNLAAKLIPAMPADPADMQLPSPSPAPTGPLSFKDLAKKVGSAFGGGAAAMRPGGPGNVLGLIDPEALADAGLPPVNNVGALMGALVKKQFGE